MDHHFRELAGSILIVLALTVPVHADEGSPTAVVKSFQASLLSAVKDARKIGVKGRFDIIAPSIESTFHLPLMVATATSPYWRAGTAKQRKELLGAFRNMSATIVATLFDDYDGESFSVVRERKTKGPTVLVDTQIVRPDNDPVNITYVAARIKERWWLIDIIVAGGISEVKVRRNEYVAFLKQGGLPRLTQQLRQSAARLLTKNSATAAK